MSRTRESWVYYGPPHGNLGFNTDFDFTPGWPPIDHTTPGYSRLESITDQVTPKGATRQFNAVEHIRREASVIPPRTVARQFYSWGTEYTDAFTIQGISLCYDGDAPSANLATWDDLIIGLSNKVTSRLVGKAQLLVSIKEMRQTFEMVSNPFRLLKGKLRHLGDQKRSLKSLSQDIVANRYLEYRYGWGPLNYDIGNFLKLPVKCMMPSVASLVFMRSWSGCR